MLVVCAGNIYTVLPENAQNVRTLPVKNPWCDGDPMFASQMDGLKNYRYRVLKKTLLGQWNNGIDYDWRVLRFLVRVPQYV